MKPRLFLLLACVYLILASREPPWGDAHVVYETAQSLVERGRLDVPMSLGGPVWFYSVRNGKKYGVFPLGNVIAMAPGYLAYRALRALPHAPLVEELLYRLSSHLAPSLLVALACALFFGMARREGATEPIARFLTLALGLATIAFVYARSPFSEALQTVAFTWVVDRGLALGERLDRRGALLLGLACGVLFNTKLVYAGPIAVVPLYVIARHRRRPRALCACLAIAAAPALLLAAAAVAHNWLKTGTLVDSGYRIPEGVFSGDAYSALFGFFFSTGKSIFLYSPPLLLGLCALPSYVRRAPSRAAFVGAVTGVCLLLDAKFRYWHADYCWGPRLLVPLVPSWLLPAAPWLEGFLSTGLRRLRALAVGALVGAGLFVQVLGASIYWDHYIRIAIAVKDQTGAPGWFGEDLWHCHFIPEFSPLVGQAWLLRHLAHPASDLAVDEPWHRVAPGRVNLASEWPSVRLDWWVLDWTKAREARRWLFVIAAVLLAGLVSAARGLFARRSPARPFRLHGLGAHDPRR